jgi:hypothetical protein
MLAQLQPRSGGFHRSSQLELEHEAIAVPGVVRQPVGAGQRDPVLVAIELPDDLVIAMGWIEVGDGRPEGIRHAATVHGIPVPVNGCARSREAKTAITEQIVDAVDDAIGARRGLAPGIRKVRGDPANQLSPDARRDEKTVGLVLDER